MASRPTSAAGNDAPARNDRDDGVHDAAGATDAAGDAPQRAGGGGRNARPPLAPKKKTGRVVKTKKPPTPLRRKLEEPDVDWDNALPNFGRCVAQELKQLTDTFVSQGEISFSAFKRCWTTQRMSTLYHVEFWESTPARVHQIVLHQALAFVLDSIERAEQAMGGRDAVARLLAAVFALYCAYSVQLGTPKHKIAVNPREWAQLMQLEASLMSNAKSEFPSAFEEALVMLDRLSTSDNAFLKCLQGPAPRLRLRRRLPLARLPTRENVAPLRQPEQEITYDNTLEMPVRSPLCVVVLLKY
ncbi:TPA: hypothetical protein N0F65_008523 [Lagenidium giganteum]|uniref:Uncharacterized protein n=1 Tax=Lagenidium giganteum TaxID=4803 RepID=A0AAV2Z5A8_9STRA|nr:TPA: hypothetical protein N0F65_008523 [Lagenidium giganteum]